MAEPSRKYSLKAERSPTGVFGGGGWGGGEGVYRVVGEVVHKGIL